MKPGPHARNAEQFGIEPPPTRLETFIGARIRSRMLGGTATEAQTWRAAIADGERS